MHEGYCVKCKAKKPIGEATEETMKNGRKAVKGKCQTCGAVMVKILGGKIASGADLGGLSVSQTIPTPASASSPSSSPGATAAPAPAPTATAA